MSQTAECAGLLIPNDTSSLTQSETEQKTKSPLNGTKEKDEEVQTSGTHSYSMISAGLLESAWLHTRINMVMTTNTLNTEVIYNPDCGTHEPVCDLVRVKKQRQTTSRHEETRICMNHNEKTVQQSHSKY